MVITAAKEVMFSSALLCLLAGLCNNCSTSFHGIRWKGGTWATDATIKLWWHSGSCYIRIVVMVRWGPRYTPQQWVCFTSCVFHNSTPYQRYALLGANLVIIIVYFFHMTSWILYDNMELWMLVFVLARANRESNRCISGIRRLGIVHGDLWCH